MALPGDVAVDRPLKLGSTFLGSGGDEGYYTLKLDFQPESLQQANQADLLLLSADQLKLIPLLQEGDVPFHFEGSLEQLQQRSGGDLECVAYFDGNEWTLQLVQAHLRAKHRPGVPLVPGYNVDVPDEDEAATAAQAVQVAAVQQQLQASNLQSQGQHAVEHEIDPDLDDALEEALFATDKSSSQAQHSGPDQPTHSAPAVTQPLAGAEVHSQPRRPAQQAQGQQLHVQPQPPRPQQQQQSSHQRPQQVQVQVQQQQQQQIGQQQQQVGQPQQQQLQQAQQQTQQQRQQQQPMQAAQLPPPLQQQRPAAMDAEEEDDSADDDSDDPWNTFDAAAAPAPAPAAPKPAAPPVALQQHRHMSAVSGGPGALVQRSATPQPTASTAAAAAAAPAQAAPAPVQPAPAAAGAVSVGGVSRGTVSVLVADDDEEDDAGHDGHECSEDESDGVGVEYF